MNDRMIMNDADRVIAGQPGTRVIVVIRGYSASK